MGLKRRRFKQTESLEDRISQFAEELRRQAHAKPDGAEKDAVLKRLRSAEHAVNLEKQFRSSH